MDSNTSSIRYSDFNADEKYTYFGYFGSDKSRLK